jgi:hypothetical protein
MGSSGSAEILIDRYDAIEIAHFDHGGAVHAQDGLQEGHQVGGLDFAIGK